MRTSHRTRQARRGFRRQVVHLCNAERDRRGLGALRPSRALRVSATAKALDMAKYHYFDHDTPHGTWYAFLYKYAGHRWRTIGENIAKGQDTADEVVAAWMNSPAHRANILNVKYRVIGIGFARDGSTEFWCEHFGTVG